MKHDEPDFPVPVGPGLGVKNGFYAEPWSAETRFSRVDYRDVAEVAAIALTEDRLLFGTFELCAEGTLVEKLAAIAPGGIDVYFDNVGGDHLDAALALAKKDARFAICGLIDIYSGDRPTELQHLFRLIVSRVRIQGFLVIDYFDRSDEFYKAMSAWHQAEEFHQRLAACGAFNTQISDAI